MNIAVVLTILSVVYVTSDANAGFSCLGIVGGFFCDDDRTGYYDCSEDLTPGTTPGTPIEVKTACAPGERCSCFINTECTVPEADICQPIPPAPVLSPDYDWVYNLHKEFPDGVGGTTTEDTLVRNIRNGDLLSEKTRVWEADSNQTFQFIVRTPAGATFDMVS